MDIAEGMVAVVTGAAGGIGLALTEAFTAAGCRVVMSDIDEDKLTAAADAIVDRGGVVTTHVTDVSRRDDVLELAQVTMDRFETVDIVCNNAGIVGAALDAFGAPGDAWTRTFGVNVFGVVHGIEAFLPHLQATGGGHILNTASIAGHLPAFGGPYSASKAAVVSLSETLYTTMQAQGMPIGVSCLCPGWVRTDLMRNEAARPETDAASKTILGLFSNTLDEGMPPAQVADLCLDAIRTDRFWIFPHEDFLELAVQRYHRIAEQENPLAPEQLPGAPSTEEVMTAVLELMAQGGT